VATSKSSCCLRKLEPPGHFSKTLTNISVLSLTGWPATDAGDADAVQRQGRLLGSADRPGKRQVVQAIHTAVVFEDGLAVRQ
jgi:hypothetical protein